MLYVFGFLSLFSPAIFLQSRLLDSPLVPIIGTQQKCLGKVCLVYPSPGTNLLEFMDMVPPSGLPTIGPGRAMMERDDDDGGHGGRSEHRELQGRAYGSCFAHLLFLRVSRCLFPITAPPFFLTQKQSPLSVEMFSSLISSFTSRFHENDTGADGFFPRPVYVTRVSEHPSSIPRPLTQPHCLRSDKAWHIRNETCLYTVSGNDVDGLRAILPLTAKRVESRFFVRPRCQLSEKALYLLNGTCSILSPLPSTKAVIKPGPVPQLRCLTTDKALHLLNDTCIIASSVDMSSKQTVEADLPSSSAVPYHPISTFSLPCLSSRQARRVGPLNCGYKATPDLVMALNWDIKLQAALLSSQPIERTPAFLTIPIKSEPPMCHRRRDPSLVSGVCTITTGSEPVALPVPTMARVSVASKPLSLVGTPRLLSIMIDCIIACLLIVLGMVLPAGAEPRSLNVDLKVCTTLYSIVRDAYDVPCKAEEPPVEKVRVRTVHFDVVSSALYTLSDPKLMVMPFSHSRVMFLLKCQSGKLPHHPPTQLHAGRLQAYAFPCAVVQDWRQLSERIATFTRPNGRGPELFPPYFDIACSPAFLLLFVMLLAFVDR